MSQRRLGCAVLVFLFVLPAANAEEGAGPRLVAQIGHAGEIAHGITRVVFSPDGRVVLTGGNDGTVVVWETATGNELRRFEGDPGRVTCIALSQDGRYLLTGDVYGVAVLWDVASGKEIGAPLRNRAGWMGC